MNLRFNVEVLLPWFEVAPTMQESKANRAILLLAFTVILNCGEIQPAGAEEMRLSPSAQELQLRPSAQELQLRPSAQELQLRPTAEETRRKPTAQEIQPSPTAQEMQPSPTANLSVAKFEIPTLLYGSVSGNADNEGGPLHTLQRMSTTPANASNLTLLAPFLAKEDPVDLSSIVPLKRKFQLEATQNKLRLQEELTARPDTHNPIFLSAALSKSALVAPIKRALLELTASKAPLQGRALDSPHPSSASMQPLTPEIATTPPLLEASAQQKHEPIELNSIPSRSAQIPLLAAGKEPQIPVLDLSAPALKERPLELQRPSAPERTAIGAELIAPKKINTALREGELVPQNKVSGVLQAPKRTAPAELSASGILRTPLSSEEALAAPEIKVRARPIEPPVENVRTNLSGQIKPRKVEEIEAKHAVADRLRKAAQKVKEAKPVSEDSISWDAWFENFGRLGDESLVRVLDKYDNPAGMNTISITVTNKHKVSVGLSTPSQSDFDKACIEAYQALNGNELLAFPEGSQRASISFVVDNSRKAAGTITGINGQRFKGLKESK